MRKIRVSNLEIQSIIQFLDTYNLVLKQILTQYGGMIEPTLIDACIKHAKLKRSLNQKAFSGDWYYLEKHIGISGASIFAKMKNTKFVHYEDFSYENFILSHLNPIQYDIESHKLILPKHAKLKTILVPEELIEKERQDTIYNSDWI